LDSRFHGNDSGEYVIPALSSVIPAEAGIQPFWILDFGHWCLFVICNFEFVIYYNSYFFYNHYNCHTGFPPEYNPAPNGAGRE
jgi:hypothetical protein